ncbi:MAG: transketolase C-terminal domain-containing protein, partial [Pseudomonadota bacterium]
VVHDVALQNLPVRFALVGAGLVGADGPTHAGAFDVGFMAALPNMVVMAPSDEAELAHMVQTAVAYDAGPIAFRFPRGEGTGAPLPTAPETLPIGKARLVAEGADVAILSFGAHFSVCEEARAMLAQQGVTATLVDARFAKPLDRPMIQQLARHHKALITVEQGSVGGFGAMVLHELANAGALDGGLAVRTLTLPDRFIDQASPARMYEDAGLSAVDITATALQACEKTMAPNG